MQSCARRKRRSESCELGARTRLRNAIRGLPRLPHYRCEALEPRRLLTFVYNATEGDDDIRVSGEAGYTLIGGQSTFDIDIVINLFGGNDSVDVVQTSFGTSITIRGGLGDDFISVGNGNFALDINGYIDFQENPDEGRDGVFISDAGGHDTNHNDLHISASKVYAEETATFNATVNWSNNVEFKSLFLNSGDDEIFMDSIPNGLTMRLGAGNDRVNYSPNSHVLFGFVMPATIEGASGDDTIVFNDDQGGDDGRDYPASATSILNQTVSGIEDIVLNVRRANNSINTLAFAGLPASESITINGVGVLGLDDQLSIGSIDLDASSIQLNVNLQCVTNIWVFEDDLDVDQYYFYTEAGDAQVIAHGSFIGRFTTGFQEIHLHAGGLNDVFNIADQRFSSDISIYGGGGNDTVQTVNFGTSAANLHDNDLDAIFSDIGGFITFEFFGEGGTDVFDLNDSADQIDDDDASYVVSGSNLRKRGPTSDVLKLHYDSTTELVTVAAGAENNTFTFSGYSTQTFTLNGGAGNDLFQHDRTVGLQNCRATVQIIGGTTTDFDTIEIHDIDPAFSGVTEYRFDSNAFSYFSGLTRLGGLAFGGSMEKFDLLQGAAPATTRVNIKATDFTLNVAAGAGNDTFIVGGGDIDTNGFFNNTTVSGGLGTDSITFDDRFDDYQNAVNENETYTLESNFFRKDTGSLSYFAFEEQTIRTADVMNGAFLIDNTVNINNISINFARTTVLGGSVRGNGVHVSTPSTGNISNLVGDFAFHLGTSGGNAVFLNDHANQQSAQYAVQSASLTRSINFANPRTFAYSGLNFLVINGGPAGDLIEFYSTPAGMIAFGNGNAGSDTLSLGGGGGASIGAGLRGRVDLDGGANLDSLFIDNGLNTAANIATLTGSTFAIDAGPVHNYTGVEGATVFLGNGSTDARIRGASVPTQVYGGSAGDTLTFGNGDIDANIPLGVTVHMDGGGGTDHVRLDDLNDATAGSDNQYFVQSVGARDTLIRRPGSFGLQWTAATWAGFESALLDSSNVTATIEVQSALAPLRVNGNAGGDSIRVGDAASPVTVNGGAGLDALLVNSDWDGGSDQPVTVVVDAPDDLSVIEIRTGGTLRIVSGGVVSLQYPAPFAPILNMVGTIDLAGGALLVQGDTTGGSLATLRGRILAGRNGGAWNGTSAGGAINSSLAASTAINDAVGYGTGAQVAKAIGGFLIAADDTLIRYALGGDATLNGKINIDDYGRIDGNVADSGSVFGWTVGDFNYDDKINIDDYGIIDSNIAQQGTLSQPAVAAVTEDVTEQALDAPRPPAPSSVWSRIAIPSREMSDDRLLDDERRRLVDIIV